METTVGNNRPTNDIKLEVRMLLESIWLVTMRRMAMKEHFISAIRVSYTTKDSVLLNVVTIRGLDIWPGITDLFVDYTPTHGTPGRPEVYGERLSTISGAGYDERKQRQVEGKATRRRADCAAPLARAPYRLAPLEMEELSTQL
ncbi:hypothetical protein Tco_0768064 [Tanacetum coccineum]